MEGRRLKEFVLLKCVKTFVFYCRYKSTLIQCKSPSLRWHAKPCSKVETIPSLTFPLPVWRMFWLSLNLGVTSLGIGGSSGSADLPQALGSVCAPTYTLVRSGARILGAGETSEAFKVRRSNLTCQYSCPMPVRGSAGDKWGFKDQRICYCDIVIKLTCQYSCPWRFQCSADDRWDF